MHLYATFVHFNATLVTN